MIKYIFILTLLVISPSLLLSDSKLSSAFANAYVEGELELFYYDIDRKSNYAQASSLGGSLKYTTDTKFPLFASLGFHSANPIGKSHNPILTTMFNNDNNASVLNVVSESFLAYRAKKRILKLGNVRLKTPMMNDDTTRTVPWSYQGFTYTGTAIKDTKIQLNYISAIRSNTSPTYKKESASGKIGDSGISMLGVTNTSVEGLNLQAYYYYVPELYSTFISQIDYQFAIEKNTLLCFGLQYYKSGNGGKYVKTENRNGGDDIDLLALRINLDAKDFEASLNYSQNFGISGLVKGYGGLSKVYTSSMIANGRGNYKPETWMLKSSYNLPLGLYESEVAFRLTDTKTKDSRGNNFQAYYLHFKHYFTKEASVFLRYENLDFDNQKDDTSFFRAIFNYRFVMI